MKQLNADLHFRISGDTSFIHKLFNMDDTISELLNKSFEDVNKRKKGLENYLQSNIDKYPHIPQFKNRLYTYYQLMGETEKARQLIELTIEQHPDYLFGKISLALELYYEECYDKMLPLLGESLELRGLYPERDIFHESEVANYYMVVAFYLNAINETEAAWEIVDKIEACCLNFEGIVEKCKKTINKFNSNRKNDSLNKKKKGLFNLSFFKNDKHSLPLPTFENKIVKTLYEYDFTLPKEVLEEILALPEESLVRDMKLIITHSFEQYEYLNSIKDISEENVCFLLHAIFILAEKGSEDALNVILTVLRKDKEFTDFYLSDSLTELLWIAIYKLSLKNVSPLFSFLKERKISLFNRCSFNQALIQLYFHNENLRTTITESYKDLTDFYIENKEDEELADTELIADIASSIRKISKEEFKEQIKQLYKNKLVDMFYIGSYDSLMSDKSIIVVEDIPTIYEMYEEVVSTWAGYNEEEYDDEDDVELIFPNLSPNLSSPSLPSYQEEETLIPVRTEPKIGRNDPCPCGSGKKYKKCCLAD